MKIVNTDSVKKSVRKYFWAIKWWKKFEGLTIRTRKETKLWMKKQDKFFYLKIKILPNYITLS